MPENNINNMPNNNEGQNNTPAGGITPPGGGIHYDKIEIPQEYYDQKAQAESDRIEKERQYEIELQESKEANKRLSSIAFSSLLSAIIIFVGFYISYQVKDIAMLAIPVVLVIITIMSSLKSKKESVYHTSVLVGGMCAAVLAYVMCLLKESTSEYWMHFAISCAIAGSVGYIICSIIHAVIANRENIKALGYIGILLFFVAIIGGPYYFYKKNPEEIYKFIFMKTTEVKAETEFEFIVKTLKNRYGIDFECQTTRVKTNVQKGRRLSQRICTPKDNAEQEVIVQSLAYNEGANQYIIIDNYLDVVKLNDFRLNHATNIMKQVGGTKTNFYIYPKENCTFIGDCAECDEYYANYANEIDVNKQYAASSKINYENYLNQDAKEIINNGEFKYVIAITGVYDANTTNLDGIIENTLSYLNSQGLKNKYGYVISINTSSDGGDTQKEIYKVTGEASSDQTFKDPKVVVKK